MSATPLREPAAACRLLGFRQAGEQFPKQRPGHEKIEDREFDPDHVPPLEDRPFEQAAFAALTNAYAMSSI